MFVIRKVYSNVITELRYKTRLDHVRSSKQITGEGSDLETNSL
jgi:hypothetical protein